MGHGCLVLIKNLRSFTHLVLINKFKDVYGKDINMERLPATSKLIMLSDHDAIKTSATKIK